MTPDKLRVGGLYRVKVPMVYFNKPSSTKFGLVEKINCPIYEDSIFMVLSYTNSSVIDSNPYFIMLQENKIFGRYLDLSLTWVWFEEVSL